MPLSSAEVAAQIGQYQQLHMAYAQQSGMIGQMLHGQGSAQNQSQDLAGGIMNRAQAIGVPMMGMGLGLAGLDPIGMGMRAASFGAGRGMGMMGAGMMGLGAATGVGVAMAGVQYAGQQILTGAQQQQAFNQAMRQTFYQQTPWGQGFTTGQTNQIGASIRHLAGEMGPAGELSSFRELSSIALRMGQMGQMTGVRDVQEFTRKFKQTVETLKSVAREMNTSLEAAQEFTQSMKSSGIFRNADQLRVARDVRSYSVAGGLAASELTSMGNIGSQISRSIGGRGIAGMYGGMKTMGQIGLALQTGALNEEDIYNATGQTGAEGRQAYATAQMSSAAGFLRGRFGRMFLASMAGTDGHLDRSAVDRWHGGGVGVGETRGMTRAGVMRAGRAGFLRNEGKLRGAALGEFGGLLPAMAMQGWLNQRGMDVETMGDREMIMMSRLTGMGMEQIEDSVRQLKNMPAMENEKRMSDITNSYLRQRTDRMNTTGIKGLQKKFEQTREHIQSTLQQVGANMYSDLSNTIESAINRMTGNLTDDFDRDILQSYEAGKRGDKGAMARAFGLGGNIRAGAVGKTSSALLGGMRVAAQGDQSFYNRLTNGGVMGLGTSDLDRLSEAGYGGLFAGLDRMQAGAARDQATQQRMQRANQIASGAQQQSASGEAYGSMFGDYLKSEYLRLGIGGKSGAERVQSMYRILSEQADRSGRGDTIERQMFARFKAMGDSDRAAFTQGAEGGSGMPVDAQLRNKSALPTGRIGGTGFATRADLVNAIGEDLTSQAGKSLKAAGLNIGVNIGAPFGLGAVTGALGASFGGWLAEKTGGDMSRAQKDTMANILLSENGRNLVTDLMAGGKSAASARAKIQNMGISGDSGGDKATGDSMRMFQAMDDYMRAIESGKPDSPELANMIASNHMLPGGGAVLRGAIGTVNEVTKIKQEANVHALSSQVGIDARTRISGMVNTGMMVNTDKGYKLSAEVREGFNKKLGARTGGILSQFLNVAGSEARLGMGTMSTAEEAASLGENAEKSAKSWEMLQSLPISEQRKAAAEARASGRFAEAEQIDRSATSAARISRLIQGGGAAFAASKVFGLHLSRAEMGALETHLGRAAGKKGAPVDLAAGDMMQKLGILSPVEAAKRTEAKTAALKSLTQRWNLASGDEKEALRSQIAQANKEAYESQQLEKAEGTLGEQMKAYASASGNAAKTAVLNSSKTVSAFQEVEKAREKARKEEDRDPIFGQIKDAIETSGRNIVTALKGTLNVNDTTSDPAPQAGGTKPEPVK